LARVPSNAGLLLPVVGQTAAREQAVGLECGARLVADQFIDEIGDVDRALEGPCTLARSLGKRGCGDVEPRRDSMCPDATRRS
jgi:hypothetical protein